MRKLGHVKSRNHLTNLGKLLQGKTDGLVMNKKKDRFATVTTLSKSANSSFGVKISRHIISWSLNEINLKSRVASTKPYISKKNKMSRLKFAPNLQGWSLTIRVFIVISRTLVGDGLTPLQKCSWCILESQSTGLNIMYIFVDERFHSH